MSPHDWPEDSTNENGNYECFCVECGVIFIGLKRRVLCRKCDSKPFGEIPISDLLDALGWQGGTVADALAEVRRLRLGMVKADEVLMALRTYFRDGQSESRDELEVMLFALFDAVVPRVAPLGQGVAALLPEHGEVKNVP